jgi:hypothetical protein
VREARVRGMTEELVNNLNRNAVADSRAPKMNDDREP